MERWGRGPMQSEARAIARKRGHRRVPPWLYSESLQLIIGSTALTG